MIATGYGGDVVGYYGDEFENDESDDEKTRNRRCDSNGLATG